MICTFDEEDDRKSDHTSREQRVIVGGKKQKREKPRRRRRRRRARSSSFDPENLLHLGTPRYLLPSFNFNRPSKAGTAARTSSIQCELDAIFESKNKRERERERERTKKHREKGYHLFFFPSHFQTKKKTRNEKKKFLLSHFFLSLFYSVNVQLGPREERLLITGLHTVADISCAGEDDVLFFWLLCSIFSSSGAFSTLSQTLIPSC